MNHESGNARLAETSHTGMDDLALKSVWKTQLTLLIRQGQYPSEVVELSDPRNCWSRASLPWSFDGGGVCFGSLSSKRPRVYSAGMGK
eukprot:1462016-Amphidinium_carterae.1